MQIAQAYETSAIIFNHLHKPFRRLIKRINRARTAESSRKKLTNDFPIRLVLAFDEAANLIVNEGEVNEDERYTPLRRVLRLLFDEPIWTIFLSTNSKIERFIVPASEDPSVRVVDGSLQRVSPFIALETDIEAAKIGRAHV